MRQKIILIHGYNKKSKDMKVLKKNLEAKGYEGILVDLPLTFKEIEHSTSILESIISKVIKDIKEDEKIHLVGHSTGGLIIRHLLTTTKYLDKIGKCVLIATPNNGSELADIAGSTLKIATKILKTLKSLQSENVKSLKLKDDHGIEIAAIAGNKQNLFLGRFLTGENDGRVRINSVKFDGLKDFISLPYGHKDIHYQFKTAELIDSFLKNGKFDIL
ncbi:alpha/beta fold hydrolase [Tepidibacter hydrothermalis]|uniref:Alpha/beta fold hydrolase n=1 Tax=Tepidibacter hydrothermalis TaxID=3036126 RepID=A0ABY8EDQ1_9FIRM|nr:alpha/beta fold hydrolase [Tepidibacter hydrothermalis]WFD09709.1 alpha/beta fold hydrolase [Tepidibacter hydrothermalis]